MAPLRRFEWLLFLACFVAFAWFDQGGGWNQNSRFDEVRAIVEEGRFAIDDFLVYKADPSDPTGRRFVRAPVHNAEYQWEGEARRLSWVDMAYELYPVNEDSPTPNAQNVPMIEECNSGDIGYVPSTGNFHPNKPPGTSFLGVPAYWLIYHFEKWRGLNPDDWWTLTVNAWLTSVFSVGLVSAIGCVVFFRLARELIGGKVLPALLATLAFAFGTTFFPFATLFFDHNLTAIFLLMAFSCLWRVRGMERPSAGWVLLAGICAGIAAVTNYIAAGAGFLLGLYALLGTLPGGERQRWNWRAAIYYVLGVVPLFFAICWYAKVNFGSPFKLANDFQNPLFRDTSAFLGMFYPPSTHTPYIAGLLTVSPYRGIFFLAPVTIMSLYGFFIWLREKTWVAEARLCLGVFGFFFIVNVFFNGYHGGFAAGPRYLVPGLPFLALPLVVAFARWCWPTVALAVISIANQTLLTATDAQNSLAVGGHARLDDAHRKDDFFCQIVGEYAWPLFASGRDWPVLNKLIEQSLDKENAEMKDQHVKREERVTRLDASRKEMRESIVHGEATYFILGAIRGPVSVNPIGAYDGLLMAKIFLPETTMQTEWNSFNVGEFWFPQRRASLLPLLVIVGGLATVLLAAARKVDSSPPTLPAPISSANNPSL
ncbi:MAG TPA: hypothetical protein VGM54_22470 [Chthoniobacter sp.]|jgi:hypothetical protein